LVEARNTGSSKTIGGLRVDGRQLGEEARERDAAMLDLRSATLADRVRGGC